VVIEIGAGIGLLSVCMATIAQRVYAIEVDPAWAWGFTKILYDLKQPNLTYIFGKAESMIGLLKADVVVILTRSGHDEMQEIAGKFGGLVIDFYEENPNMD
jgi:predicted RNA methylase